jgi:hypothetical protein
MKIVLGGYIVGYPLGGMTWHHLNYLLGLIDLGHEVTYLEDGANHPSFDPIANTHGDPTYGLSYLRETFEQYGIKAPWHYRYGKIAEGLSIEEMQAKLREADLFIAVSGVTPIDWYDLPKRTLVIDTDPVFTQLKMSEGDWLTSYYKRFTHVATFGRLIGTNDSPLPTHGFDWIATNQPIALNYWPTSDVPTNGLLTTVGKWEHTRDRVVEFAGRKFASDKSDEYEKLLTLPKMLGTPIEMRMAALDDASRKKFEQGGWTFGDPVASTISCRAYQEWIRDSLGEFTVTKSIYSGLQSGWFSDRSACFLASGRSVITQSSGYHVWIDSHGEGLFGFSTRDEAYNAVRSVLADPIRHGRAARRIAERHFNSRVVLNELLDRVMP